MAESRWQAGMHKSYGYEPSKKLHDIFTEYHKTHNQAVFDVYTPEMKKARHNKIITGLSGYVRKRPSSAITARSGTVRYRFFGGAEEGRMSQLRRRNDDG